MGLLAVAAALSATIPAGAALVPIDRTSGDLTLPRVRVGQVAIPRNHASGLVRVIVGLPLPALASSAGRALSAQGSRRLNVASAASRSYLARLSAAQRGAAAGLMRAIPQARIGRRYQVVLNGFAVTLPVEKLPVLARLGFVTKVYPSVRYHLATDTSPSVIGATELQTLTGATGDGIKIAIVDDGVDSTNPFLNPAGYSYPAGFPKGGRKWTTPKVIVARAFPGPNAGRRGRLPIDREASFHATHVAGIAAGDAGTCSAGGSDHPPTCGLSGVAPRAWIGNYRVFNVPTPIGHIANTPEIAAAFESAVRDGMDVINFSGGGAETEPANDAMIDVIRNVAAAGVVPVISAGNDRDQYGMGTVGSPGSAPEAITVAAVSNTHVFAPVLSVRTVGAPADLRSIAIAGAAGSRFPGAFALTPHRLVDVGALTGTDGKTVDRGLCGPDDDTNNPTKSQLRPGSLDGDVALVSRGHCTFISKALRALIAGATALVLVDNRAAGPDTIPLTLGLPSGMISDFDGARLRAYLATTGGTANITVGNAVQRVETGRSGVITSFSSGGPTAFEHLLKPDVSAPGGQILSSTLPEFTGGSPFAVFDGTSMAAPHVAGAAALLIQLHRGWSPQQVKSALVSTAGAAWEDTARTREAPATLEGGGLVDLPRAARPRVLTEPASLSFQDLDVNRGSDSRGLLVRVTDAGDGAGTWQIQLAPQATTNGASLAVPAALLVPPGGEADLAAVARASADAVAGEDYGFIILRRGEVTRKIPYEFFVGRPQLGRLQPRHLERFQAGDTVNGPNRVSTYCCPSAPFGQPPDYVGPAMNESGTETLYVTSVDKPVANIGVAVVSSRAGSIVDPWFLGSANERDVQGYAGTPVNVNELMYDFSLDIGAAGASFPKVQRFYVAVDSGSDDFTQSPRPGSYVLRSWVNDVRPPRIQLLTKRVAAGRPTIVARVLDKGAGVDPLSLVIGYRGVLVGAVLYDPTTGIAIFPLPAQASKIPAGRTRAVLTASDYQEAKNVNSVGADILPNTAFKTVRITGVSGPALTWVTPAENVCVGKTTPLVVVASSTTRVRSVRFLVDGKRIGIDRRGASDLFTSSWSARLAPAGKHELLAVATDAGGRTLTATRHVKVCR
ncbi:MAG: minor extracellular serine protease Vpr [Gaiellaceae bacterium]|nr:minor extracellular serine protease Vpr [Gaiellaceae bacterium]